MVKVSGTYVLLLSSLPSLCDICLQETFALELLKLRAQVSKQTNISAQVQFSEGPVAIFEAPVALCVIGPAPLGTETFLAYRNNFSPVWDQF